MQNTTRNIALGFLAVLAVVVTALIEWRPSGPELLFVMTGAGASLGMLFGGVTLSYKNVGSGATPPTAAQAANVNSVVATIIASANGDAAAVITHNMQLSAADIAAGWPTVLFTPLTGVAQTSNWSVASVDPNWVGLAKNNTGGGGDAAAQLKVVVARPHTIVR